MSKLIRRIHMYLALFLTPWVLMYALSTFVMNHRGWFRDEPPAPPRWEPVSEQIYDGVFPNGANYQAMGRQILMSLELDGAHQVSQRDSAIVVLRNTAVHPLRLTFHPGDRMLKIEKQALEAPAFLERMHRRRGFQHPYGLEDAWALSVDFFIVGVLFWALSGLWLWWELKTTRGLGALAVTTGLALFALFLSML